jgi:hypothetical protein
MPPLKNQKHENFCRLTLEGSRFGWTQADIYKKAGYRAAGHSAEMAASRLMKKDDIRGRIAELGAPAVRKTRITIESLLDELRQTIDDARAAKQHTVVVSSLTLAARLVGLLTEKVEIGRRGSFTACNSIEEVLDKMVEDSADDIPGTLVILDQMREALMRAAADRAIVIGGLT